MSNGQLGQLTRGDQAWHRVVITALIAIGVVLVFADGSPRAAGNFTPTITFETSTTRAAANPDARITIDNSSSSEDIKDVTIDLPNGVVGSLDAAVKCDAADAASLTCGDDAKIGTVVNDATVDNSDVRLAGDIYLTDPFDPADPAGLQIIVPAVIGGVDMGVVHVNARVQLRYAALPTVPTPPPGAVGQIIGIRTIVTDVPNSITDDHGRTVEFSLRKLVVDLKSDQAPPRQPLLTNPSSCAATQLDASFEGYASSTENATAPYAATDCSTANYLDPELTFTPSSNAAGSKIGFTMDMDFPTGTAATQAVIVQLPPAVSINSGALGSTTEDQCPVTTYAQTGYAAFDPTDCPVQAKVGSVTIETPLLSESLEGDVYLINKSPIPNLGIYIDETTGANNPAGVQIGMIGTTATPQLDSTCNPTAIPPFQPAPPPGGCKTGISATFIGMPDAPVSSISVVVNGPSRVGHASTLDGELLAIAAAADLSCQPNDDITSLVYSHTSETRVAAGIDQIDISGCSPRAATVDGAPYGGYASSSTPTLDFVATDPAPTCAVDTSSVRVACPSYSFTPGSALPNGPHYFWLVTAVPLEQTQHRAFVVPSPGLPDTAVPTISIDSGPSGTTSDSTPQWTFSSNEDSFFQCSVDDGAFLPCESGASAADTGSLQITDPFFAGTQHKFAVRAQDEYGNISSVEEVTIDVQIAFAPSLSTHLTTTQARAHPNLDLTISSLSNEDVKSVGVSLPDGFFGGLTGVQSLCPLATAAAGNCTAASRAGTVETEARVDDSLVRIDGEVFLTESAHAGEPAGLSIKVPAVIQDVNLGDIIVSGRLIVRGQAQGIDSLVVEIPKEIDPADSGNTFDSLTEFDMRKITLKLRTGPGATYPLLTNPSSCNGSAFVAYFNGYANSSTTDADAFASTGCGSLPFSPRIAMSVVDSTTGQPPVNGSASDPVSANLTAVLSSNPGYAGIKNVGILMPKPLTINVLEIPPACEVAQYANGAGQCPAASIVGSVSAISPLLPEPLGGSVYLLKQSNPAKATPRLLIALRGRINVDIIADNSFVNGTQILTTLNDLPDVPLSSFTINVDRVLSTRNEACTVPSDEWNAVGNMTDFNGRTAPINQHLVFGCEPQYSFRYRNRGDRSFLNVEAIGGPKQMRKLTIRLPLGVRLVRKNLKRKLVVRADGKRLSSRCYRVARATLTLRLCGRDVSTLRAEFRRGSLTTNRKAAPNKRVKRLSLWGADRDLNLIRFNGR